MYIFKAAVVGSGFMGAEIAQVITFSGLPVVMKDIDQAMLDKGMATIRRIYQRRVDKGKMTPGQVQEKLDLVIPTLDFGEFDDVDIVIEAVPENIELKKKVFAELDEVCPPDTILATNTSALSIKEIGAATKRPHKVVGMHFFSPAHVMKLVEVIPSDDTDEDTLDTTVQFAQELRKMPVTVKECPGFLVNRLLMPYLSEATRALQESAATASCSDCSAISSRAISSFSASLTATRTCSAPQRGARSIRASMPNGARQGPKSVALDLSSADEIVDVRSSVVP